MSSIYSTNIRDSDSDTEEAQRLLDIISGERLDSLSSWEQEFIESVTEKLEQG